MLFIERQVAHVWAGAVSATISVFVLEMLLGLPVLRLAPMLAVIAGMTFVVKAGMLSGTFYVSAAAHVPHRACRWRCTRTTASCCSAS